MIDVVIPVLLSGGSGTRLWPVSRKSYPKQFANLLTDKTLFQESALRLVTSEIQKFDPIITLTNTDFRFVVGEQLTSVGIQPGPILLEPEARNTAPAILAASMFAHNKNHEAILLVAPSDHAIPDVAAFHTTIQRGLEYVNKGKIITFGIKPTRAETGYGYLHLAQPSTGDAVDLLNFVEKPSADYANEMVHAGNYLWNAGIFMFRAVDMIAAFEAYAPEFLEPVRNALDLSQPDLSFLRLDSKAWSSCENKSIDYAIMEKAQNLAAMPFSAGWSDLGDWNSVLLESERDDCGVAVSDNAYAFDCENTLLRSESHSLTVVGIGLKNAIVSATSDAILVSHTDYTQELKVVVDRLKQARIRQAETFPIDHRPWGWFETLVICERFQVKRIFVKPNAALSLQSHHHRSEHWVVVSGTAKVTVDEDIKIISEGQSVYIPLGSKHRLENPGKIPMLLIEVQTGTYLGEDDITRYEDLYDRNRTSRT